MIDKYRLYTVASLLALSGTGAYAAAPPPDAGTLEEIVVTGVRASEQRSVELKRNADMIQDSISAEDIGKLPDATISDSLQRITGVQIDRAGGEGTSVNIRGLPQVGTQLNGEAFLTTAAITSPQPDFGDIPSQLFSGADVIKSSTADLLNGGITGTINLRTQRPFDLRRGWTTAGAAQATRGTSTGKNSPEVDGLVGYHAERWGILASASYSDVTLENSVDGLNQYGGMLHSETSDNTTTGDGFLNAYVGQPLPSGMVLLHPGECDNSSGSYVASTPNGCDVDVNGDGKANAAFYNTPDFSVLDQQLQRKRLGFNLSAQAELGRGYTLTAEVFYTNEKAYNRTTGYQLNSAVWEGATFLPAAARNTGVKVYTTGNVFDPNNPVPASDFYATQRYQFYMGDIETFSNDAVTSSNSKNYNLQLKYDQGGRFSGDLRGVYADASQLHMESYLQYAVSDGTLWANNPFDAAPPGTYVYPGGNRVFDALGFAPNVFPAMIDFHGDHMSIALPSSIQSILANPNAWSLKTITSENDYDRSATMKILRANGHLKFDSPVYRLDFGLRASRQDADNANFALVAPVYGGQGAYHNVVDPTGTFETGVVIADPNGCYVRYKAADITMDGTGVLGGCKAGDPLTGFYRAGTLSAQNFSRLPAMVANNTRLYNHLAGIAGVPIYALDPKIMDDVLAFQNALYPGEIRNVDPGATWRVAVKQTTGYVQGNFKGTLWRPFSGNIGFKAINTKLEVYQHIIGPTGPYYVNPDDLGTTRSDRSFTDVLPAFNLAFELRDNLKLRFAYAKNMQLLDLNTWGGGLVLDYAYSGPTTAPKITGGTQNGSPDLKPWRSTNYDVSVEYYFGHASLLSLGVFHVNVASFIGSGTTQRCDLPDQDNVVRRCVTISGPVQGAGKSLGGVEAGLKQPFDFLPGHFSNLGVDANFTYSPSNVGTDVAGNTIPFQDNSKEQANLVLWYQSSRFQARIAGNYRSKRAVSQDFAGLAGFEEYQAPTHYYDLSASYELTPNWQVFASGTNLTKQQEHLYLVWPDQKLDTTQFEARYAIGVRARY